MCYLYVLKSLKEERKYIGITQDIKKRLAKHKSGSVRSTKGYRPWELVYKEKFETKMEARIKEIKLKKNGNKRAKLFRDIG